MPPVANTGGSRRATTNSRLQLALVAQKAPVLNGDDGLSQKSAERRQRLLLLFDYALAKRRHAAPRAATTFRCRDCPGSIANGAAARWPPTSRAGTGLRCSYPTAASSCFTTCAGLTARRIGTAAAPGWPPTGPRVTSIVTKFPCRSRDEWDSPQGGTYPSAWEIRVPGPRTDACGRPGHGRPGTVHDGALLGRRRRCHGHARRQRPQRPWLCRADGLRGLTGLRRNGVDCSINTCHPDRRFGSYVVYVTRGEIWEYTMRLSTALVDDDVRTLRKATSWKC